MKPWREIELAGLHACVWLSALISLTGDAGP